MKGNDLMTRKEKKAMKVSGKLWNLIESMSPEHPADLREAEIHIHALQNIILSRVGLRAYRKKKNK
jgi:hypothetical protein